MRLGVNAVIVDAAGRVLLALRDRPPIWNLPGGGVEPGEAPWDAAVRDYTGARQLRPHALVFA